MRTTIKAIIIVSILALLSSAGFAQDNQWENEFVLALQKGKALATTKNKGLAYTPAQSTVLENAIKKAMDKKAPPCEAMKIAVDLKYNPYSVIKNIFSYGGEVDLNQLCMCATESGVNKQVIAKAATDAASPLGKPIFPRDEIAQAQCLREIGLGYTPVVQVPPPINPPAPPVPFSVASP